VWVSPRQELNPGYQEGNPARNLLDPPDFLFLNGKFSERLRDKKLEFQKIRKLFLNEI